MRFPPQSQGRFTKKVFPISILPNQDHPISSSGLENHDSTAHLLSSLQNPNVFTAACGANNFLPAQQPDVNFPSTNLALELLLTLVKGSSFVTTQQHEPSLESPEGQDLLRLVSHLPGFSTLAVQNPGRSIYTILVGRGNKCLICDSFKTSLDRAVACVRLHLGHRPFVCSGESVGCTHWHSLNRRVN